MQRHFLEYSQISLKEHFNEHLYPLSCYHSSLILCTTAYRNLYAIQNVSHPLFHLFFSKNLQYTREYHFFFFFFLQFKSMQICVEYDGLCVPCERLHIEFDHHLSIFSICHRFSPNFL